MELADFEHFRDVLLEQQRLLTEWLNSPAFARVDDAARVQGLLSQIREALARIKDKTYGQCTACDGEIEHHRLEIQPVTQVCLDCISDQEKAELEKDLFLAGKIHRALLPQTQPVLDGVDIEARSLAAGSVGGDYYDFLERADGRVDRIVVGDVMGKGFRAGLLMSNLQGAMRILSPQFGSPGPLLERLNTWMCRNIPVTKFISLVLVEISAHNDRETRVTYTNAGHPPPILFRANGEVDRFEVTGGILGVHEKFSYEEQNVILTPGDLLLLYTDGIVEAENPDGDQFEDHRLIEFVQKRRDEAAAAIIDDLLRHVQEFTACPQPTDDMTAILLRRK